MALTIVAVTINAEKVYLSSVQDFQSLGCQKSLIGGQRRLSAVESDGARLSVRDLFECAVNLMLRRVVQLASEDSSYLIEKERIVVYKNINVQHL